MTINSEMSGPNLPTGADGKHFSINLPRMGHNLLMPIEAPLNCTNPMASSYQNDIYNQCHATKILDFLTVCGGARYAAALGQLHRRLSPYLGLKALNDNEGPCWLHGVQSYGY